MVYGYARVSTRGQSTNGNSLESQRELLIREGAQEVVADTFTGTKMERPVFTALLDKLQTGDTLMVTKLDRFARTAAEGAQLVKKLINDGIIVNILNMGRADNTPMGKLMITILSAFAEYERDMIVERTQTGKAIAKRNPDYKEGRPRKFSNVQIKHAMELLEKNSYNQVEAMTGISKSTLIRAKKRK